MQVKIFPGRAVRANEESHDQVVPFPGLSGIGVLQVKAPLVGAIVTCSFRKEPASDLLYRNVPAGVYIVSL